MGSMTAINEVKVDATEWELTQKRAQLSCELWLALLGGLDAAGMGAMVPAEIRAKIAEVTRL
jgi:hypothetical protein